MNQHLVMRALEKQGHAVTIVSTGAEALKALERHDFDVVLMDVQMPEMDGIEATRLIRQRERSTGRHIPIIAMTACAMSGDKDLCLEAGMDAYLSKPISLHRLLERIQSCHALKSPVGDACL